MLKVKISSTSQTIFYVHDKLQLFFMLELKNISFANKVKELLTFMTSFNSFYWKWKKFPLEVKQLLMSMTSSNSFCRKWKGSPLKIKQLLISMTSLNFSFHLKKSWFKKLEQLIKQFSFLYFCFLIQFEQNAILNKLFRYQLFWPIFSIIILNIINMSKKQSCPINYYY